MALNMLQLRKLGTCQLNKPFPPFNHHKSVTQYVQTLNMLQLCKLGTCQLNKLSFPHNHHKSVTQYVRTMKPSPLYKSAPTTSPSTKTSHSPPSRTASSPSRSQHAMRSGGGTDYDAPSSSNATSKHKKQKTSHNTTKHCKKTSPYSHSIPIKSTQ